MEPEVKKTKTTEPEEETYELLFRNGALANLKKLAGRFNVPEDNLKEIVNKAIKLLTAVDSTNPKQVIIESKNGDRFTIDAKDL